MTQSIYFEKLVKIERPKYFIRNQMYDLLLQYQWLLLNFCNFLIISVRIIVLHTRLSILFDQFLIQVLRHFFRFFWLNRAPKENLQEFSHHLTPLVQLFLKNELFLLYKKHERPIVIVFVDDVVSRVLIFLLRQYFHLFILFVDKVGN